jgi:ribonuclease VapC
MIIVADTSAFVTILQKERDAGNFRNVFLKAEKVLISAATAVELNIVVTARLGEVGILKLNHLLTQPLFEIVDVNRQQMVIANLAYERFGKGRHPAKLNYGDLFSYSLAKQRSLPLLFKGDDFSKTDIVSCL